MAFASVGTLGSALSSGNNQATLVLTTSAAAEVGNLVVIAIAVDNSTGTGGASTDVSSLTDNSPGGPNIWTRAVGFTNTNGGAAQDGADISIWYSKITTQVANGGTITATFANATTSDATAMSAWEFTVTGGVAVENTNTLANDAAAAGSLDATTANIACLRFRAIASESNSSTALTKTAAFDSLITQAVSGAGTSATEMGVRGEFAISTGTGLASAPTGGAGAVDNASAYVAFKETTAHVGEARFAGAGSFSAQAVKKPSEATFAGAGWICPPAASSLLHFNGTDGTQVFVDERGHTWTANGDVHIEQDQSKFGGTSAQFDGAGDALLGDGSSDFGFRTGDFTIDFWARPTTTGTGETFYDGRDNGTNGAWIIIGKNSDNTIKVFVDSSDIINGATALSANQWYHIALTRSGTSTRLFLDGVQQGSTFTPDVFDYQSMRSGWPIIGSASFGSSPFTGFIDEFRVLKGQATWVGGFSPPTSPYTSGLAVNQNMAAQERLGGAGSFSVNVTGGSVETIFIQPLTNRAPPRRKIPPVELRPFGVQLVADTIKVGEANFTGSGNFSANALLLHASRAIFAGAGSLSINAILAQPGQATFAGSGSLSVNVTARFAAQATFAGAGSFSVDAVKSAGQSGEATFAGTGNFRVLAQLIQPAFATFQGSGNVSVNANLAMAIQARFNGAASFSVDTLQSGTKAGEARFNGAGNLSVDVTQVSAAVTWGWHRISDGPLPRRSFVYKARQSVAIVYPLGEVTVEWMQPASRAPTRRDIPAIDLRPFGVQAAAAAAANQIEARFEGAGGFRVNVTQRHVEGARFNGAGSLSVDAAKQGTQSGEATFQGAGNFRVNVLQAHASQATFFGAGNLSVEALRQMPTAATFAGAGSLSVNVTARFATQATFAGSGSLSAYANLRMAIQATFQGTGNLSVEATIAGAATQHSGNAIFNGAGNFSVNVLQVHSSQARFAGAGNYSVNVTQQHVEGARFNGVGNFSVDATQVAQSIQQAEGRFNGVGNLSVNVVQAHVEGARFAGAGNVSARLVQGCAASAIFGGVGSFSVDTTQISTYKFGEATFAGAGNFRVNVTAKYAADVRFTGTGNLLCNVVQRHTAQARFAGAGSLSANTGQVSTHQGQARFNGAGSFSVNTFVLAFGSSLMEATFHGEGGMIINITVTGPRHVQSTRPQYAGPVRHNTAYTGRNNFARTGRRNVA